MCNRKYYLEKLTEPLVSQTVGENRELDTNQLALFNAQTIFT